MTVKVDQLIQANIDEVWSAITNPAQMRLWYFDNIPDFKPEVGFTTRFEMDSGERIFTATWKVTKVLPKKEIRYDWSYDEYEGTGPVTFRLSPQGEKTHVTVTNEGMESFPQNIPEFKKESCLSGWNFFIKERLPQFFDSRKT